MNEPIFPLVPLDGLSDPAVMALSLALSLAFGFFLERAGVGSARNLTSIFILRDFRVFRVMFSAVITAVLGSRLLGGLGLLDLGLLEYDPTFFWSMLAGGLVFGVGFYVGGFCPGTAAVALARGRWDGAAFLVGIVLGIYAFALLFDVVGTEPWFTGFFGPAGAHRLLISGDGPVWPWVLGLTAVALVAFKVVPQVERRFALKTVEQLAAIKAGETPEPPKPPAIEGWLVRLGPPLAGAAAIGVAALELSAAPAVPPVGEHRPTVAVADEARDLVVSPRTMASWVLGEAHRRAQKKPANAFFVDLRGEPARGRGAIPGAVPLEVGGGPIEDQLGRAMAGLRGLVGPADRAKPLVLIDEDGSSTELALALRRLGLNAMVLEGGFQAWRARVLEGDEPLYALGFDRVAPPPPPPAAEPVPPPVVDLAQLNARLRGWLAGRERELPPQVALPGAVLLPAEAATVRARGGGGGCG